MEELTYTVEYVPIWVGALVGLGVAVAASVVMYIIGIPVEKIVSRKKGVRPLFVPMNVIAFVLLVSLTLIGGGIAYKGLDGGLLSKLHTVSEDGVIELSTITVNKAAITTSRNGSVPEEIAVSTFEGDTYRINNFKGDYAIDALDTQLVPELNIACIPVSCTGFSTETEKSEIIDTVARVSIKFGYVVKVSH